MAMPMRYIFIFFLLFLSSFGKRDDQLTHTKPVTHGDMLVSKGGDFALGFFSPMSSNKSFYLGMWYHGLPGQQTVVWVANRDDPITNPSSAMLTITNNSRMVLSDSEGRNIWMKSTNITAGAYAVLLNSGNFVLRSLEDIDIWQSFDHPTDTILPSMKVLVSYRGHAVGHLVAWKGPDDPSFGDFSFSSDSSSAGIQLVTWNKTKIYCRNKVWSGLSVSGGTYLGNGSSILYQTDVYSGDEFYSMFTVSDNSPFMRITLDYTGKLKSLTWDSHSSSWALMDERPAAACELYASCGPFSYCDSTQIIPACQCLEGFEPVDSINFSRGCRRKQELKCGEQSRFVPLPGMMVPDKFLRIHNRSFDECAAECNRNCSCIAYAYANLGRCYGRPIKVLCLVRGAY